MSKKAAESGVAIVELIMVMPFLFLLFFASTEISKYLRVSQIANVVSQEAAQRASRACADYVIYRRNDSGNLVDSQGNEIGVDNTNPPALLMGSDSAAVSEEGVRPRTKRCLNRIATTLRNQINAELGTEENPTPIEGIAIHAFRFRPVPGACSATTQLVTTGSAGSIETDGYTLHSNKLQNSSGKNVVHDRTIRGTMSTLGSHCNGKHKVIAAQVRYRMYSLGPIGGPLVGGGVGTIFSLFGDKNNGILTETTIL